MTYDKQKIKYLNFIKKINKFNSILQENIDLIYKYNSSISEEVKYTKKNKFVKIFTNDESVTIKLEDDSDKPGEQIASPSTSPPSPRPSNYQVYCTRT